MLDDLPTLTDASVQVLGLCYYLCAQNTIWYIFTVIIYLFFFLFKALVSRCHTLTVISVLESPYLSDVAFKAIAGLIGLTKFQIEGLYYS